MWSSCPCVIRMPRSLWMPLLDVSDVRDYEVDAEHVLVGEHQAGVDDRRGPRSSRRIMHVLADLPEAAQGDDFQCFRHGLEERVALLVWRRRLRHSSVMAGASA